MKIKTDKKIDWIIAGLGNPGSKYANTRHNIGWMVAMALSAKYEAEFVKGSSIFYYSIISIADKNIIVVLPTTYMNASGEAIVKVRNKLLIPNENIVVICDEYNFPLGKVHLKKDGSDGGHNGVASVIDELDSTEFIRLRCGIGKNFTAGGMVDYVLSDFNQNELDDTKLMIAKSVDSIEYLIKNEIIKAMTDVNSGKLWKAEELTKTDE